MTVAIVLKPKFDGLGYKEYNMGVRFVCLNVYEYLKETYIKPKPKHRL